MYFTLLKLEAESVYEYVFERYTALNSNADDIRQDLGIENTKNKSLTVEISADFTSGTSQEASKSGKRKKSKKLNQNETFYTFDINQQLTSLHSSVDNGNSTTGYVLWSLTPFFVRWLLFNNNSLPMRQRLDVDVITGDGEVTDTIRFPPLLDDKANILELGAGISSILPIICCNHVSKYICTDQRGILNGLKTNIMTNLNQVNRRNIVSRSLLLPKQKEDNNEAAGDEDMEEEKRKQDTVLEVLPLDWELFPKSANAIDPTLKLENPSFIIAMDVIYNEYLIDPFLETLKTLLQNLDSAHALVGFHLRSDDIVQQFLEKALDMDLQVYVIEEETWKNSRYDLYYIKL
ncbi:S-adenosylmethionine-dependent methyltransferase [Nakaseomyces bracarensis]|uniref:S-adenosylmethionine-dependent methyltransferase n=1 Tax=Nakaseomyces bracarensis TaxID=273131 RepID=UPI003871521F